MRNLTGAWLAALALAGAWPAAAKPNIVIVLADDMGWRDTGFSGNPIVKTPHLDDMASKGLRFDYFYAAQQMCSPGRFALLTGRTPCRTGLHHLGAMRPEEITIARALKPAGYRTAHFGKWHLGGGATSPVKMGFDQSAWSPNYYDLGAKLKVNDTDESIELQGDTSVAAMGLALEFVRKQAKERQPFLAYVCFGSPHSPHRAAPEFKDLYKNLPEAKQNFWGEISGLDRAVGDLRAELRNLGIAEDTIVWFTSDNGGITPESKEPSGKGKGQVGVRTVSVLEWPARVKQPARTSVPTAHMDMYPTLLDIVGVKVPDQPVLDGVSLVPLLDGKMEARGKPLGFMLWNGRGNFGQADFVKDTQGVWIDGSFKLIAAPAGKEDKAGAVQLYDIFADPAEKSDLAGKQPDAVAKMRSALDEWRRSVRASFDGKDFAPKKP